ncbi:hybrid sensor histidine kinase/response regulator [Pleurocapsa sp. CCALA 161]|uniref:PAS domain S-box protein n=1 Tax=Pleurocapsa sp. CCALA 161 TaxID=2107688 RepID=UPI000D078308|nr:PAS domain S-box protein [Pleurocapsa sp. CCALA 161]PSB11910.1 hybrid sensor histidine kinase/response regulator [Pleurocapsa sp. CCALA 161]
MNLTTQTVLLVDDCLEDRITYRRYLSQDRHHSYRILEAETGQEAFLLCRQEFPDVILLDYLLPDMDGLEFLGKFKKNQFEQANLSVVILTGQRDEKIAVEAMKNGAAEYLVKKNLTPESLRVVLKNVREKQAALNAQKQAEETLQFYAAELEIKVQERTAELVQANLQLQQEIKERQQAEAAVQESERRLSTLINSLPGYVYRATNDRNYTPEFISQGVFAITEYKQEDLVERTISCRQDIHPDDANWVWDKIQQAIANRQPYECEYRIITKSGTQKWVWERGQGIYTEDGELEFLEGFVTDISEQQAALRERKSAEIGLREMSAVLSNAVEGISQLDSQGRYLMVNQAYASAVGYQPEEMLGMEWQRTVHPEDIEMVTAAYQQMLRAGKVEVEARGIRQDGSIFYKQLNMIAVYNEQRQLTGHYCFMKDISERQAALRERKSAEQKIREQAALLDIASDAIYVRDLEHRILFWNSGAERLYGWTVAETVGRKTSELMCHRSSFEIQEAIKTVLEVGSWQGELQKLTKSGNEAIVSSRMTLVRDEAGQAKSILTVDTDITEKKQIEAQFYRAQRLESLGTLASGIAHDINNILTPIIGFAQLLPLQLPNLDARNRQMLEIITDNAKRGAELVKQILLFAQGKPEQRVVIQLKNLLKEIEHIVKETFPNSIEIFSDQGTSELWTISADPTQIYQVLINLCVNARDAMPDGGTLTIAAENQFFDRNYVRMNLEAKIGNYVVITVSDTGCGVPKEIKERIFEPFFTTKGSGKGTGLGLSTALGIVKNHDGFVNLKSEIGKGSQFQVCLPAIDTKTTQENSVSK